MVAYFVLQALALYNTSSNVVLVQSSVGSLSCQWDQSPVWDHSPARIDVGLRVNQDFFLTSKSSWLAWSAQVGDEQYEPEELKELGPRDLSYWIASNFREMPQHQQILLQANPSPCITVNTQLHVCV